MTIRRFQAKRLYLLERCFYIIILEYLYNNIMELLKKISIKDDIVIKKTREKLASFPRFSLTQKIPPRFFKKSSQASIAVAHQIKQAIHQKNKEGKSFVLGLATGSTPLNVYRELIRLYKSGELSFKNVVTFNLDEYYPIEKTNPQSYNEYMNINLFNHIDIPKENVNIPNGQQCKDVKERCAQYENKIAAMGGIDLQILGIGKTGHIGFNEPPAPINSITRLVHLHRLTRKDAAQAFGGIEKVPKSAITMGIQTIMQARRIIIMAWGESKSEIVKKSIEGEQSAQVPSTFLQLHKNVQFYLDMTAGQKLARFNIPWTIKGDAQDPIVPNTNYWLCKKVIWLAKKVNKSILRLSFQDYQDNHLSDIVFQCANGVAQDLNLFVNTFIQEKISGWPLGGKPEKTKGIIIPKKTMTPMRVLIFSPHPDDDVISMGGTLNRLTQQGHDVSIVYMTSGSNAVYNYDAQKYLYFFRDMITQSFMDSVEAKQVFKKGLTSLDQTIHHINIKNQNNNLLLQTKKLIRLSEAKIAAHHLGVPYEKIFSLDLPFYYRPQKKIDEEDLNRIRGIFAYTNPQVIYAAGDLTDPHSTHRICLELLMKVIEQEQKKESFPKPQMIFLYRGAWQEWQLALSTIIIPLSPEEIIQKQAAILKHQSQKDNPMFPGEDKREFWQRSKERNRETAHQLKELGFSEYEGAQCFVNYNTFISYDE